MTLWWCLSTSTRASERPLEGGGAQFRLSGSAKTIADLQFLRDQNLYTYRTQPQGEERIWLSSTFLYRRFMAEFTQEASVFVERQNPAALPVPDLNPVNAWDAQWSVWDSGSTRGIYRIPRLYLQLGSDDLEIRVGKQVIATGVGKIFSTINQVPRLPFTMVDQEYQRGEDAVSVVWGRGLVLEGRFLPKVSSQRDHNFHLRAKAQRSGYDIGLTTGRSDDKLYIGLEIAGNLGEDLFRAEVTGFNFDRRDVVQALVGFDHVFGPRWSLSVEAFHNGFGTDYADYRFGPPLHRSTPYRGRWYGGLTAAWEISDRLKANLATIVNVFDPSALFHLQGSRSLGNNLDLLLGGYLNWAGRPQGEFGGTLPVSLGPVPTGVAVGLPDLIYTALRWYF